LRNIEQFSGTKSGKMVEIWKISGSRVPAFDLKATTRQKGRKVGAFGGQLIAGNS